MKIRYGPILISLAFIALLTVLIPTGPAGAASVHSIRINADGAPLPIGRSLLGSNLPAWLGPSVLSNNTFRSRTIASGMGLLRIPGGSWSDDYGWLSCEMGANQTGAYPCGEGWESWASKPTDLLNFVRAAGEQAMYTMNVNVTAQEAAAAVAFFNGSPDDTRSIGVDLNGTNWLTVGHWAQLRADHGNLQPLGIRYWEFGNEVYGGTPSTGGSSCPSWGWENSWTCDGAEYVTGKSGHDGYLAVRAAMRAVDPNILVGAVGTEIPSDYSDWGNKVVAAAGSVMDFYVVHPYAYYDLPSKYATILAQPETHWAQVEADLQAAFNASAGGRQIPIAATEYNLVSSWDRDKHRLMTRMVNGLFIADSIGQAIKNGHMAANQWDLANGCEANGTCYDLLQVDHGFKRSPQYYAFPLWSRFGTQMLPTSSDLSAAKTLSIYGGRIDSTTLSLLAINKTGATVTAKLIVDGAFVPRSGNVDVLAATSLDAQAVTFNGVRNPSDDLSNAPSSTLRVKSPLTYKFKPYSITLIRLSSLPGPTVIENEEETFDTISYTSGN